MSELPEGWAKATVADLAGPRGLVTDGDWIESKDQDPNGEVRLIQLADIGDGEFRDRSSRFVTTETAERLRCTQLVGGDVLVARMPDPLGRACIFPGLDQPAITAVDVFIWRGQEDGPDGRWLMHAINSPDVRDRIADQAGGTTRQRIAGGRLKQLSLALPPLPEQRRIVAKIDSLSGKSGRARDHLDHIPRLVEKYKQAVLTAAFRGDLTKGWREGKNELEHAIDLVARTHEPEQSRGGREATSEVKPGVGGLSVNDPGTVPPDGWAWVRLRRIARQETGHTPSRSMPSYWDGDIPWIGIRDAGSHHGRTIRETAQTISEEGLANSSARLLPTDTVCLSRTASVGYVTIMGRPMATSQDFATWSCSEALLPKYLMYALIAEGENIREFGEGSTHTTIYFPEIRALHICLAPLEEQAEIVKRVEACISWIDYLASEATSARSLIDRLDQAVLAKAFRGELVPQDPNDEPASVLLERIRAERAAMPKTRKVRRAR
ncbi:MAG: restriction endonuclease subunit S [Nitratireductor sp.]|nr:restriction endonuclease subunit S [Nitratireductor sp.]